MERSTVKGARNLNGRLLAGVRLQIIACLTAVMSKTPQPKCRIMFFPDILDSGGTDRPWKWTASTIMPNP